MSLFYCKDIDENLLVLDEEESRHAQKVLRLKPGDAIEVTSGKGDLYVGEIVESGKKHVSVKPISKRIISRNSQVRKAVAIAPTKSNDRLEWFVEKAVEIGIDDIFLLQTKRTERDKVNMDRLQKICVSAMKQSKNLFLPEVHPLISLKKLLDIPFENRFVAHCMEPEKHLKSFAPYREDILVLIGPEGDFTPEEVGLLKEHGLVEVSLGPSRLRTETAGLYAVLVMNLV